MQQLPISPVVPQASGASPGQASAPSLAGAAGGEGLEASESLNFGAILGKQIKGMAAILEQPGEGKAEVAAEDLEAAQPLADLPVQLPMQVDLAALAAPAQPAATQRVIESEMGAAPGQGDLAKSVLDLPGLGKETQAAEIAGKGNFLPQPSSTDKPFAENLAALVEASTGKHEAMPQAETQVLAQPSAAHSQAASVKQVETVPVQTVLPRVGSSDWGGAVGEKVVWMAGQNHQVAELHLNPPSLGPLEVRLSISNDQATALFVSHHSAVRDAIETALPRLREMLADSGIMLGNAMVSSESFSGQQAFDRGEGRGRGEGGREMEMMAEFQGVPVGRTGLARDGMVDIFA